MLLFCEVSVSWAGLVESMTTDEMGLLDLPPAGAFQDDE